MPRCFGSGFSSFCFSSQSMVSSVVTACLVYHVLHGAGVRLCWLRSLYTCPIILMTGFVKASSRSRRFLSFFLGSYRSFTGFLTLLRISHNMSRRKHGENTETTENTEKRSEAAFLRRRSSGWRSLSGDYPYPCVISSHCLQHLLAQLGLVDGMKAHSHSL